MLLRLGTQSILVFGIFVGIACRPAGREFPTHPTVRLEAGRPHQTILGWEAGGDAGQDHPAFLKFRDRVLDLAVDDLRLTRFRLTVRSGAEHRQDNWADQRAKRIEYRQWRCARYSTVNDNDDPQVFNQSGFHFSELDYWIESVIQPLRERFAARGSTPWITLAYVAFTGQICDGLQYDHDDPEEYAEFILAAFLHIRDKYGFVPDAVKVILEPDNTDYWRGRQIGEAIVATARRLAAHGFTPQFTAPSNTNMRKAVEYFDDMIAVPGVRERLGLFAYHRYGGVSRARLYAIRLRSTRERIPAGMTERIGASHLTLYEDLTIGENSVWAKNILAYPDDVTDRGMYYWINMKDPQRPAVEPAGGTGFFRQYFRYIPPGARRIEAASNNPDWAPVAFVRPDGGYVVVVRSSRPSSGRIDGLPSGRYGVSYSTDGKTSIDAREVTHAGAAFNLETPGGGVFTVYAKESRRPASALTTR